MNEILVSYVEDLRDSILAFSESLMQVQKGEHDAETINTIFRVAHTIKGNSAAMSFMKIQKVMHTMEDVLSEVRNGVRELNDKMVQVLFSCHDFLEDCLSVVQSTESDESMDTDSLMRSLEDLKEQKEGKKVDKAEETRIEEKHDAPKKDVDLGMHMPSDLWELLYRNVNNGYSAYFLHLSFMKNSAMKAVRAWMIFDRIDQSAIVIHSKPERISDAGFNQTGETVFEHDSIEMVIVSEQEISELVEDLRTMADIDNVTARIMPIDDIKAKVEFMEEQNGLVTVLHEISVDLLGVDIQYISEQILLNIKNRMQTIINAGLLDDGSPVIITAKRLSYATEEAIKNKRRVPIGEKENIIFICQSIEECITSPDSMKNPDLISVMYRRLDDLIEVMTAPEKILGDILAEKKLLTVAEKEGIHEKQLQEREKSGDALKFGQMLVKEKLVKPMDVINALNTEKAQEAVSAAGRNSAAGSGAAAAENGFVRVPVTKVDSLIDMLSELLIYNSQLEQNILSMELVDPKTSNVLLSTEKLIKEIQALSMSLRMIEIKQTFHRLARITRDTATDLGKKISISLEGEDTEIDRSAVEKLFEPLMHMVRNAVSHGIEDSEAERVAVGKKPEGHVTIYAYSQRGNIYVEVRDDGRGINTQKVYEKAKRQGLIVEGREYTDEEIYKFIFLPGFSTQENVDAVSGRGVGMNVVEEVVSKLGGKIEVESELGVGSCFRIKLPINLAVVNGTIVEIDGMRYIIPTMCVKKFFMATDADWVSLQGEKRAVKNDGNIIPLISKEKVFGISDNIGGGPDESGEERKYEMVTLEIDQKQYVLHVDKIINRQDVVSKPLTVDYASVPYTNSASILGDGIVSLILDIDAIFKMS